jgi:hypothetical protein
MCRSPDVYDGSTYLVTDGDENIAAHESVVVSPRKLSGLNCFRWVNTVIGNTKNSIWGAHHSFKIARYARQYLAEIQYQFNRRFQLEDWVPRLLYACAQHSPRNLF